jgi:hypothetical protein
MVDRWMVQNQSRGDLDTQRLALCQTAVRSAAFQDLCYPHDKIDGRLLETRFGLTEADEREYVLDRVLPKGELGCNC